MFVGIALSYDQRRRRCDLAFSGRDFVLDTTPLTPVLISLGCDRRAHTDDVLPDAVTNNYAPQRLNARRGWCGDALDKASKASLTRGPRRTCCRITCACSGRTLTAGAACRCHRRKCRC